MKVYSVYTQQPGNLFTYEGVAEVFSTHEKAEAHIKATYPGAREVVNDLWEDENSDGFFCIHIFETEVK